MLKGLFALWTALLGAIERVGQYLAQKQLLDAGGAQQKVEAQKQVETNVQKAEQAVSVPDPVRTERLRKRFDAGYGNE